MHEYLTLIPFLLTLPSRVDRVTLGRYVGFKIGHI